MMYNLTHVQGFKCWGAHVGIKSKRRDLALIYSEKLADSAAVFTRNLIQAEPIKLAKKLIQNGKTQAIAINSGNANACTGKQGEEAAKAMAEATAESLNIPIEHVLIASTGIIGEPFPTEKVVSGIYENKDKLSDREIAGSLAASAILTTDTFPKEGFVSFHINDKTIHMAGIAKGSGMIHPNMGTMLGFIVCDLNIEQKLLDKALKEVTEDTFNMITVDGDTSTNDMVAIMCNGMAGNERIKDEKSSDYKAFKAELYKLCEHLAKLIVSDGEGATKFIEYRVVNAKSKADARQIIHTISDSTLVKTAIFGNDPNWGRIIAAAGRSGVAFDPDKIDLYFGFNKKVQIVKDGNPISHNRNSLKNKMKDSTVKILLDLKAGNQEANGWGSDLSYEYVRINAEYTT